MSAQTKSLESQSGRTNLQTSAEGPQDGGPAGSKPGQAGSFVPAGGTCAPPVLWLTGSLPPGRKCCEESAGCAGPRGLTSVVNLLWYNLLTALMSLPEYQDALWQINAAAHLKQAVFVGSGSYQQAVRDIKELFPEGFRCSQTSTTKLEQVNTLNPELWSTSN